MLSSAVIRASELSKSYRIYEHPADRLKELLFRGRGRGKDFWALQGVDLIVQAGEAVGVIGRNGSGKSTLLQLICGLLQPTTGEIAARGRVAGLLELGAGFNPDFTGRENVQLAATILGLRAEEIAARFEAIEAFAGIGSFIDRPVREYSSGMYARLAFAVCAHVDADVLVIDEILAVGDAAFQQKCIRYLRRFQAGGGTLLFVSHSEGSVLTLCERAIWLDRGQLQADGPAREVCRRYAASLQDTGNSIHIGDCSEISGKQAKRTTEPWVVPVPAPSGQDPRWRGANPIQVMGFDRDAPWHGENGAVIEHVGLYSPDGTPLTIANGGAEAELRIMCRAMRPVKQPIVGFILRNERGENLAGDNTYLRYSNTSLRIAAGATFTARFHFQLPYLPAGEYRFAPAITEGTQADHVHLHWMENALALRVSRSPIRRGTVGVPMLEIEIS